MNKLIAATALITPLAFATEAPESNLSVYGTATIGGFATTGEYGSEGQVKNNGATGVDVFVDYERGNFLAQYGMEADLGNDHSFSGHSFNTIDAWIGYKLGEELVLSAGLRGDSALDEVDGMAEKAVEFNMSPEDASDVVNFMKLEDKTGGIRYGISVYEGSNSSGSSTERKGVNGYFGITQDTSFVNFGFENNETSKYVIKPDGKDNKQVEQLYMVNGGFEVVKGVSVGAFFSKEDLNSGDSRNAYGVGVGITPSEKTYIGSTYNKHEDVKTTVSLGGKYFFTPRLTGLVDLGYNIEDIDSKMDGEAELFVRMDYSL